MNWAVCRGMVSALAWLASFSGVAWWGSAHMVGYLFVLCLTLTITAWALTLWNVEKQRRASWRAGWAACQTAMAGELATQQRPAKVRHLYSASDAS